MADSSAKCFVPHKVCTVSSGDCFTEGKCLRQCRAQQKRDMAEQIRNLEGRVHSLEMLVYRRKENGDGR